VGFDGGLVHVGLVKVCDFALVGASGSVGLGGVVDDAGDLFEAEVNESVEDAEGSAIRRKFCLGYVGAVGVEVKVVAGRTAGSMLGMEMPVSGVCAGVCAWAEIAKAQKKRGRMRRGSLVIGCSRVVVGSGRLDFCTVFRPGSLSFM
jgi:hypothetical protein